MAGRVDRDDPTKLQVKEVMSQFIWNVSGSAIAGVGRFYVGDVFLGFAGHDARYAATDAGLVFFPGAGISYGYTWGPKHTVFTPHLGD